MLTASFSEARQNLTEIADRVANDGVEYTIFKRSKPLFKIVPVTSPAESKIVDFPKSRLEAAEYYASYRAGTESTTSVKKVPDGGQDLLAYIEELRARTPKHTELSTMTVADMKRELGERFDC